MTVIIGARVRRNVEHVTANLDDLAYVSMWILATNELSAVIQR